MCANKKDDLPEFEVKSFFLNETPSWASTFTVEVSLESLGSMNNLKMINYA